MGACTVLAVKRAAMFHTDFEVKAVTGGFGVAVGTFKLPASYDTSGSTLDLSSIFQNVPDVVICAPAQGVTVEFVAGTTTANGLAKCYSAVSSHSHDLKVVGSSGVTDGTQSIQHTGSTPTAILKKNAATDFTFPGGTNNIQNKIVEIAGEVASTTDLSSITVSFVAYGLLKVA